MPKHLLFVTTHNLATNPRLVKEIETALKNDFQISVVCFEFHNWSKEMNDRMVRSFSNSVQFISCTGDRTDFKVWLTSTIVQQFSACIRKIFPRSVKFSAYGLNKRTWLIRRMLKRIKQKPDWIIAHNPGSFYPAWKFSKDHDVSFGVDLEDYHPGETNITYDRNALVRLQNLVLKDADYVSAAAPLMIEYAREDAGGNAFKRELVLMNYFPKSEFVNPVTNTDNKLKLVWFSQHISANRGLDLILKVLPQFDDVELHLYGTLNENYFKTYLKDLSNVVIHDALPQQELFESLSKYDVGVALESVDAGINRDICITNKMLAYFQAGLYILATDTKGQAYFLHQHPTNGMLISSTEQSIKESLEKLKAETHQIRSTSSQRYEYAGPFNWENASEELIKVWHHQTVNRK